MLRIRKEKLLLSLTPEMEGWVEFEMETVLRSVSSWVETGVVADHFLFSVRYGAICLAASSAPESGGVGSGGTDN